MAKIERKTVEDIAKLARLELSEAEFEKYQKELSAILGYAQTIQKADTKGVEPTSNITGLSNVLRADKKVPSNLSRDEVLSNAPDKKDGYIKVKPVLD